MIVTPRWSGQDPQIREALAELEHLIQQHYPDAAFETLYRDDPSGVRLRVTVDTDDVDSILDIVIDKLYQLQVEQELPIYILPVPPAARVAEQLRSRPARHVLVDPRPLISA